MAVGAIVTALEVALVARHAILVGFDAAAIAVAVHAKLDEFVWHVTLRARPRAGGVDGAGTGTAVSLPPERQIRRRHDLDEVHKVERALRRVLRCVVQRAEVMARPGHAGASAGAAARRAHAAHHILGQLRTEAQVMHLVREGVRLGAAEVVVEVVHVHVAIAEALARREVEVAHDLIDADAALDAAALAPLRVELLAVVLALALLHALAVSKGPGLGCVRLPHFGTRIAAARLASC